MNVGTALLMILFLQIMRKIQRTAALHMDNKVLSPSDYTILATGFPWGDHDEDEII